jgi:arginase
VSGRDVVVVGVPIDSLGKPGGTELAPAALREQGIVEILGARDGVAPLTRGGAFPVVLGGCCTLVPGVAAALRASDPGPAGLAYIDGHLDLYDGRTSPTGEAADVPLAVAVGHGDPVLVTLGPAVPMIEPRHVALLAHRDTDEARSYGSVMPGDLGIGVSLDCAEVQSAGLATVGAEAASRLSDAAGRFWLSIDVDVMSDGAFPTTPVKQPGGLEVEELVALARPLASGLCRAEPDVLRRRDDDADRSSARALVELTGASLLPARDPVGSPDARVGVAEEAAAGPGDADRPVLG